MMVPNYLITTLDKVSVQHIMDRCEEHPKDKYIHKDMNLVTEGMSTTTLFPFQVLRKNEEEDGVIASVGLHHHHHYVLNF